MHKIMFLVDEYPYTKIMFLVDEYPSTTPRSTAARVLCSLEQEPPVQDKVGAFNKIKLHCYLYVLHQTF